MNENLLQPSYGLSNSKLELTTASVSNVLSGKTFYSGDKNLKTGTMTNRGAWNSTIAPGNYVTIPSGYHNGSGKVTANNPTYHRAEYIYYPWTWTGISSFDARKIFGISDAIAGRLTENNFFGYIRNGQLSYSLPNNEELGFTCHVTYEQSSRLVTAEHIGTNYGQFIVTQIRLYVVWAT